MNKIKKFGAITVVSFASGPLSTNAYIVVSDHHAFFIDAPPDSFAHFEAICKERLLTPTHLVLTHSHWDHIADAKKITNFFAVQVLIHKEDSYNLKQPGADGVPTWLHIEAIQPDQELNGEEILHLINQEWAVIHTPGHTPGGICLLNTKEKILFSGDTLFKGTYGNICLPTSEPERMAQTLRTLASLPQDIVVFPGHGLPTKIADEDWLYDIE